MGGQLMLRCGRRGNQEAEDGTDRIGGKHNVVKGERATARPAADGASSGEIGGMASYERNAHAVDDAMQRWAGIKYVCAGENEGFPRAGGDGGGVAAEKEKEGREFGEVSRRERLANLANRGWVFVLMVPKGMQARG